MNKPALPSPAGPPRNFRYAIAYGADAIYCGAPRYSLRVRNNDFSIDNLRIGIEEAHAAGKKVYVVTNVQPHSSKLDTFSRDIQEMAALKPDAFIVSDPGVIYLIRKLGIDVPLHISVQANSVNWADVEFWKSEGASRVILSRELSVGEIRDIREKCPDIELEVFVHGALCVASSGRCLLSGYMCRRDANQGACTNSCRWDYSVYRGKLDENGAIVPEKSEAECLAESDPYGKRPVALIEERNNRPGELMPLFEDEHGAYILNSKDLCAVRHVAELAEIGVDSLKIEGRTKSAYYVARTASAYRRAIDDAAAGKPFDESLYTELLQVASRGYTDGFLARHTTEEMQNYAVGYSESETELLVGDILGTTSDGHLDIKVKNHFEVGDGILVVSPSGNSRARITSMEENGKPAQAALGSGHQVYITTEPAVSVSDSYSMIVKLLKPKEKTGAAAPAEGMKG